MGHMYAKDVLHVPNPRLGLLSIGEEETKGNTLTRDTFPLLRDLGVNFIGNVEGRDLYNGSVDVVVCDGFVGNVALKTSEGLAKLVTSSLRESLKATVTAQMGALLSRKAFNDFKKRIDYSEYGGAPLLGVRGVCIVGHGSLQRARHHERHPRGRRVRPGRRELTASRTLSVTADLDANFAGFPDVISQLSSKPGTWISMAPNKHLDPPPASTRDAASFELLRVWIAEQGQHVSLRSGMWEDPFAWGIVLADLARHIVHAESLARKDLDREPF